MTSYEAILVSIKKKYMFSKEKINLLNDKYHCMQLKSRDFLKKIGVYKMCQAFLQRVAKILLSDFDQKSLNIPKCLLSMNNNDIIVYN